ncbi:hypothetical protein GN956_G12937 [Arapaima gigas]
MAVLFICFGLQQGAAFQGAGDSKEMVAGQEEEEEELHTTHTSCPRKPVRYVSRGGPSFRRSLPELSACTMGLLNTFQVSHRLFRGRSRLIQAVSRVPIPTQMSGKQGPS